MSEQKFALTIQKKANGPKRPFGEYPTLADAVAIADALVKAKAAQSAEVTQVVYSVTSRPGAHPADVPLPLATDETPAEASA